MNLRDARRSIIYMLKKATRKQVLGFKNRPIRRSASRYAADANPVIAISFFISLNFLRSRLPAVRVRCLQARYTPHWAGPERAPGIYLIKIRFVLLFLLIAVKTLVFIIGDFMRLHQQFGGYKMQLNLSFDKNFVFTP